MIFFLSVALVLFQQLLILLADALPQNVIQVPLTLHQSNNSLIATVFIGKYLNPYTVRLTFSE